MNKDYARWLTRSVEERFWANVKKGSDDECWNWIGCLDFAGYGAMSSKIGSRSHRVSLVIHGEKLIPGLVVDHICRNRPCVNPRHLRQVTRAVNALENSESPPALNLKKTHCRKNHEYTPENTK